MSSRFSFPRSFLLAGIATAAAVTAAAVAIVFLLSLPALADSGFVRVTYIGNQKAKIEAYACVSAALGFGQAVDARFTKELESQTTTDFVINDGCAGRWTRARVSVWTGGRDGRYEIVQDNIEFGREDVNANVFLTGPFADKRPAASDWFAPYSQNNLAQGQLAPRVANTKKFTIYNRTHTKASCSTPENCTRGGPDIKVEVRNCGKLTATYKDIKPNVGFKTFEVTDECDQWSEVRVSLSYFGQRDACGRALNPETEGGRARAVYIWGPYARAWTDPDGIFECTAENSAGSDPRVKNGRVDFWNTGSLNTYYGYNPNGCAPGTNWLGIGPASGGIGGGGRSPGYYTIYNHDCMRYSEFWFEYGGSSSFCPKRYIHGDVNFMRAGGYQPGWCVTENANFSGT